MVDFKKVNPKLPPAALTTREAAEYLSVSESYLKNARWLGYGPPYVRLGERAIRYRLKDLDDFLAAGRVEPRGTA